ncbi:NAD(P)/FAD-dependent oxidoreductase [Fodinibius saliphilus]|uniref:NAD(P)/FAD-dependent oxidoreductase n=1 Tax=Fodinibius saliphilus TaxID=1920650 RepID=UPI0011085ECD|nr:FAD-binding oxidoreductase [Fodinibius saliphilus]
MSHHTDYCILGAGLAGLSIADSLADHDFSTIVIDKSDIAAGASGTPGGLVNPATGRRAKKVWKVEQGYEAIASNLEKVQQTTEETFYTNNGVLRPALMEKMARKMKEEYQQTSWPKGWCQWKREGEIKEMHPGINCVDGGLWIPVGLTVDVGKYLQAYASYLKGKNDTIFLLDEEPIKIEHNNRWHIELTSTTVRTQNLIFATGQSIATSFYWDWLPFNLIKGQVAEFKIETGTLNFDHSISSLGYMARLTDNVSFIQGSTYEHDFTHINTDQQGEEYLRKRMRRTLPNLEKHVRTVSQWAGVRTSTPNYKPILGRHPVHDSLHLFGGLGSKGLLFSKYLADHYVEYLIGNTELFPEIDIARHQLNPA